MNAGRNNIYPGGPQLVVQCADEIFVGGSVINMHRDGPFLNQLPPKQKIGGGYTECSIEQMLLIANTI